MLRSLGQTAKQRVLTIVAAFGFGAILILAYAHWSDRAFLILLFFVLAPSSGWFWLTLLIALAIFLTVSRRRGTSRWKRIVGAFVMLIPAWTATNLYWLLVLYGPFFNLAAPLTHQVRAYPVECVGKVAAGNICCGKLGEPLNESEYTISISRQQVFEDLGIGSIPLHNCEVRDNFNWWCTTYWDATGEHETDMAHGLCFDRTVMADGTPSLVFSGDCPQASAASSAIHRIGIESDHVSAVDYYLGGGGIYSLFTGGWKKHKGIWNEMEPNPYIASPSAAFCKPPTHTER